MTDAAAAGVTGAITISTTTYDCLDALAIARRHPRVWCSAGVHPLYSDVNDPRVNVRMGEGGGSHNWENLRRVARDPRCVAWGELGLDRHYPNPPLALQIEVLEEQLAFIEGCHATDPVISARNRPMSGTGEGQGRGGLPIVVHCREAFEELLPIFRRTGLPPERFVFHCFTGNERDMRALLDYGAWVSFTGVITYPNAPETRNAAKLVPDDRVMVETDAPFLAPIPHRGKRPCLPAYTAITARALAELRGAAFEDFHRQINDNTRRFFGIE